jgi:flagellin-like hook-associated protein FlgL
VSLGDGLTVRFGDDGTTDLTAGDLFYVNAYTGGWTTDARIDTPEAAGNNTYAGGTVTQGGTYTGLKNKTYVVKIESGGDLAAATYRVSSDGGRNWGVPQGDLDSGSIGIGDGITLNFPAGTFAANDVFSVQAHAPGVYSGNGEDLSVATGRGSSMTYNVTGEEAFTDQGRGAVDLFAALESLKTALEKGDRVGVNAQVDILSTAQDSIRQYVAESGARMSSLNISKENYQVLDNKISGLLSETEDVDLERVIVEFKMQETALQASYAMSVQIGKMSILDYLS